MNGEFVAYSAINTLAVLAIAPLYMSLIKKVKAWTQGRQGPPLFQTYANLAKLLKKEDLPWLNITNLAKVIRKPI